MINLFINILSLQMPYFTGLLDISYFIVLYSYSVFFTPVFVPSYHCMVVCVHGKLFEQIAPGGINKVV